MISLPLMLVAASILLSAVFMGQISMSAYPRWPEASRYARAYAIARLKRFGLPLDWRADVCQQVELEFLSRRDGILEGFRQENFGQPRFSEAKKTIRRIVNQAVEKIRDRHKIEIKPATAQYKDDGDLTQRQRTYLAPTQNLGDHDIFIAASSPGARESDLSIDIRSTIDQLPARERKITIAKVYHNQSWKEIARGSGLSAEQVKEFYFSALAKLAITLKDYATSQE